MKILRPLLVTLAFISTIICLGQQLQNNFKNTLYTSIYKLDSTSAKEIYSVRALRDSVKYFANYYGEFRYNTTFDYTTLKPGHYLFIQGEENNVKYWVYEQPVFTLRSLGINNQIFVYIYNLKGEGITDARLQLNSNGNTINYHEDCGCYPIQLSNKKSQILPVDFMVYRGADFTFGSFSCESPYLTEKNERQNRKAEAAVNNYGYTILPGYLVLNQPKFKLLDTLKWKAFLLKPNGKPYRKNIRAIVSNNTNGAQIKKEFISAASPGAYNSEFIIADSLTIDTQYSLQLLNRRNRQLKYENFQIENYNLKKSFFDAKINKNYFYAGEKIRFTVTTFDANELPILDARVKVLVTMTQLSDFFKDSLFVPFSWSQKFWEYSALTDPSGISEINFPDSLLCNANMQFNALITISNPEGESKNFNFVFTYDPTLERYQIKQENDSIKFVYLYNSKISSKKATIKIYNNTLLQEREVTLPISVKVECFATVYQIFTGNKLQASYELEEILSNSIGFSGYRTYDSICFNLINPLGINVNYKIYHGETFVEGGSATHLEYLKYQPSDQSYHVIYSFRWKSIEYVKEESFHSTDKGLNVKIDQPDIIYPGQKVPIRVHVTDYKNKDVKKVNLAAYAINSQIGEIRTPELPYFGKKKYGILKPFNTFNSQANIQNYKPVTSFYIKFPLFSESPYYQLAFNNSGFGKVYEEIENEKAEFSPFVFKDRQNQPIYAVYLDKKLIYVANTNIRNPYSFQADPGKHQVQIRTASRIITLENIELKKGKKLFFCLQDDSLTKIPDVSYVTLQSPYLKEEQTEISKHLLYFNSNFVKKTRHFFLVQGNKVYCGTTYSHTAAVTETGNYYIAGPFERGAIKLVFPGFDTSEFYFEPGSGYRFYDNSITSKDLTQVADKVPLNMLNMAPSSIIPLADRRYEWPYQIGKHEIIPPPVSISKPVRNHPALHDYGYTWNENPWSNLIFKNLSGRAIKKIWIFNKEEEKSSRICYNPCFTNYNLKPGRYDILIVTGDDSICFFKNYPVKADGSNYKFISSTNFQPYDSLLITKAEERIVELNRPAPRGFDNPPVPITEIKRIDKGISKTTKLSGYVFDQNNNPIDRVTIFMENAGEFINGAITNQIGYFGLEAGQNVNVQLKIFVNGKFYTVNQLFLAIGKHTEIHLFLPNSAGQPYGWVLNESVISDNAMRYGTDSYTSACASLNNIQITSMGGMSFGLFTGSVAGVISTLGKSNLFKSILPGSDAGSDANSTSSSDSDSLKGKNKFNEFLDRIKGDTNANRIRSKFRDYAYFIPNLLTDKKGETHFTVIFPDNQTLWKTMVPAIDYHKRTGLGLSDIKAYKPLNATLALPKFMVENDSIKIIGKTYNYTDKEIPVTTLFSINKGQKFSQSHSVKTFLTDSLTMSIDSAGKYKVEYSFKTNDNYIDGEEREIPVIVNGTEVVNADNFISEADTILNFPSDTASGRTMVTVTNNQLDLLLNHIDKLKNYSYGCNEQTASKLKALLAEKTIFKAVGKEFTDDRLIVKLIKILEKSQRKDGAWGWWTMENSPEYWMSCYIIEALNMAINAGFHTHANIRGAEYLRSNINLLGVTDRLYALEILSGFYDKIDYKKQVEDFDRRKLSLQDEFRLMRLKQIMNLPVSIEPLISSMNQTKTGIFWGEEVLNFKTNIIPTSALAYEVLKHDTIDRKELLQGIRKYFLNHSEMARNTIEQAVMLNRIVDDILEEIQLRKMIDPEIFVNGQSYLVKKYPHSIKFSNEKPISIAKNGAPIYFSVFHYRIERNPKSVDSLFKINTWFDQDNKTRNELRKSIPATYKIDITAYKSTEYVMIEIPIPSSCYYSDKLAEKMPYEVNREYFDDKVVIFCRNLPKGNHKMSILLQPRFEGKSTLLPVKASLMYYPDRFGLNTKKEIRVR